MIVAKFNVTGQPSSIDAVKSVYYNMNINRRGETMKYILMNKNTEVMLVEFDIETNNIQKIYEIYNLDYAPLSFINSKNNVSKNEVKTLNTW